MIPTAFLFMGMAVKCENVQEIFFFLADLCDEVPRK